MKNKKFKKFKLSIIIIIIVFVVSACVPGDGSNTLDNPAGFFSGIWHGWIAPFSLVVSIFSESTSMYENFNTGFWYDFGFYVAIISGFGGISLSRKKNKR